VKLRVPVPLRRKRRRRARVDAPKSIVPPSIDRFDAARDRLKRQIPPRQD